MGGGLAVAHVCWGRYGVGTYDSAQEVNEAFSAMEARGDEVEYVEVDLPEMEKQGRVFYTDSRAAPKRLKK